MLVRVFEMPAEFAAGFLFGGGRPATFTEVDWFRDDPETGAPDITTTEGRAAWEEFIRQKRYFKPGRSYLILHPVHPFTIDYVAP